MYDKNSELKVSDRSTKHTWQAMHGDSHSCKIYKGLLHNSPEKKTELSTTGKVEESSVLL